jgi:hypothetical protein
VLDAAALEKKGVHTVTVVWDNFEKAARTAARVMGVPNLQLAVVPRLAVGEGPAEQRTKAEVALPEIVGRLLASMEDPGKRADES